MGGACGVDLRGAVVGPGAEDAGFLGDLAAEVGEPVVDQRRRGIGAHRPDD